MPRATNAPASNAFKKRYFKTAKGYFGRRKSAWKVVRNAVERGWQYAYRDRRNKKRVIRALWIQRINAGVREHGLSYSAFIHKLVEHNISINRKVLADLAMHHPMAFRAIVEKVK